MSTGEELVEIARAASALYHAPDPLPVAAVDVYDRIEAFAREHPELEPELHRNLVVQVARNIDPRCPADIAQARIVIAQTRRFFLLQEED